MRKSELQAAYKEIKKNKTKRLQNHSLMATLAKNTSGCRTCGEVTWKPKNQINH